MSHEIYNVPSPFPTDAIYQKWRLYWHSSFWDEVVNERQCKRRTIDDGGYRQVAIGHLDDSYDLKMLKVDGQTDDSLTGNRKRSLESSGMDFLKLSQNKK